MSGYIGPIPVPQGIQNKESFTATAAQTTFGTKGYTDGAFINVYLNGVRLVNGTDYTATNGSDVVLASGANAGDTLDFETLTQFSLVSSTQTTPTFKTSATLKNDTHEDSDGGRESTLIFSGEQSGGEISTLAEIEASHDGTADDEKGDLIFRTNDGSDGTSPTERMRIDSTGATTITTTGNETQLTLTSTDADATTGPNMSFYRNSASPADNDQTGSVFFIGKDDGGDDATYGSITTHIVDASAGTEDGKLTLASLKAGTLTDTLSVSSGSILTPSAGTDNVRLGEGAGAAIASGGNYNIAIGKDAGTALTTGDNNVAVGHEALKTEDANGNNTAVGYQALKDLNAGATGENTAVGYQAGKALTTGLYNSILGTNAGDALTDADYNTALGTGALGSDTKGSKSVAVGYGSLFNQNFTSSTDSNNTAVGYNAGTSVTTGAANVFIGALAGDAVTTGYHNIAVGFNSLSTEDGNGKNIAIGSGALENLNAGAEGHNIAVGYEAGLSMTTGTNNTFVGNYAGDAYTSGDAGVAVGKSSLTANTTGRFNTACGYEALYSNTTGSYNTAVGQFAAGANTTSSYNTVVGAGALDAATTGGYNTAVGYGCAGAVTTGWSNNGFGNGALAAVTTGADNHAFGTNAMAAVTTTNGNIGMGHYAGIYATGTQNTVIGHVAGYAGNGANKMTTASYNVILGSYGNLSATGDTNSIAIGHNATGKGSSTGFIAPSTGGVYQGNNSSSWSTTSDRRLKKNITDSSIGLAEINQIQVRNYEYKTKDDLSEIESDGLCENDIIKTSGVQVGAIAQEIQAVLPKCVKTESTGVLSVDNDNLTWHLVKAVQELSAKNDALEARIATLEG